MYIIFIKYSIKNNLNFSDENNTLYQLASCPDFGYLKLVEEEYCITNKNECDKFEDLSDVYVFLSEFLNKYKFTPTFIIKDITIEQLNDSEVIK